MAERETLSYVASLAEQAERYDEMVEAMKNVAKMDVELTEEERTLLSVGYKCVIAARRASWRILSAIEQKVGSSGNEQNAKRIKEYRHKVETELTDVCNDIVAVIDKHLLPACTAGESSVFYNKMKGDYYRYLAEVKMASERKEVADLSLKAYEAATSTANTDLPPNHPLRLGLALNFSVFYSEILNSPERACQLATEAFEKALSEVDDFSDESYKDSALIMKLLRDNYTLWTSDITVEDAGSHDVESSQSAGEHNVGSCKRARVHNVESSERAGEPHNVESSKRAGEPHNVETSKGAGGDDNAGEHNVESTQRGGEHNVGSSKRARGHNVESSKRAGEPHNVESSKAAGGDDNAGGEGAR